MPKLPTGLVKKSGRPGYYARDQRGGRDRLVKLSNDRATAIRRYRTMHAQLEISTVTVKQAALAWLRGAVATRRSGSFRATTLGQIWPNFGHTLPMLVLLKSSP